MTGAARKSARRQGEATGAASRRAFLRDAAASFAVTLAPGITLYSIGTGSAPARSPDDPSPSAVRWGLLIDVNKCPGDCKACVTACSTENGWGGGDRPLTDAQWIRKVTVRAPDIGREISLPVMCQHCDKPPCVDVCPTGASFKRADGIVLVDKHTCIGCRYCMMACPYKARSFVHETVRGQKDHAPRGKGTVESCTLCVHRVDTDRLPACVEACGEAGYGAMVFGDLNDPDSEISRRIAQFPTTRIRADLGLDPGVRYGNL
jgi:molybdopterin-containing oxidoreductase family iron-sulfur binding subunit